MIRSRVIMMSVMLAVTLGGAAAEASSVTLAWDPSTDTSITGYRISYGNQSGVYTGSVTTSKVTSYTIGTLAPGLVYYFTVQAVNSSGLSPRSNEVAMVLDPPPAYPASNDINGDGRFDLLWQHQTTGQISSWFMNGVNLAAGALFSPGQVTDTNWKIVARGDFNGDGHPDLIWQHRTTGQISAWMMNKTTAIGMQLLTPGQVADTNWKIVGSGDFDGDGHPDLVWQHQTTGQVSVWLMNGTMMTAGFVIGQVADLNWKIAGVGDLNHDGHPDLVWRHQTTGQVSTWLMNGTRMVSGVLLTPGVVSDLNWKLKAIGDLSGDGVDDLVWQNDSNGLISTWIMNGTAAVGMYMLNPSQVPDTNWKIVGPR